MAECEKMMQLCEESLDRTLTAEEQHALDRHLAECPACAAYLADLRFLSGALSETPALPAGLHEKIMSGVRSETHSTVVQTHRPARRQTPVFAMLAAAAACVVLVLSGALGNLMNNFNVALSGGGSSSGMAADASNNAGAPAISGRSIEMEDADTGSIPQTAATADDAALAKYAESGEMDGRSARSAEAVPAEESIPESTESGNAPAAQSESDGGMTGYSMVLDLQPQVGAFISDVMDGEIFAACYLVEGGSALPEIGQEQQRDANFAYYVVDNNLAQLETLLDALEKAGCTVERYEESGVLFNETAKRVIFVVRMEA